MAKFSNEPNANALSDRQRAIIKAIHSSIQNRGYAPTVREIAQEVGLSSGSSVAYQLEALEAKGFIRRDPGTSRAMEVTMPDENDLPEYREIFMPPGDTAQVPLVGSIAAGIPITAQEQIEDVFTLPTRLVGNGDLFLLKVVGDSMIDAAICDGDWVVIRQQKVAEKGDMVAAMIDGEATVKTFTKSDGHIWLMPHNPAYTPILGDEATILGKVVAVLRAV